MSTKSKFLKAAKLAIAGVVLTAGASSCSMMEKHNCMFKSKVEKSACSAKEGKASCSAKHSCKAKTSCSAKK